MKKTIVIIFTAFILFNIVGFHTNASATVDMYTKIINQNQNSVIKIVQPDTNSYKLLRNRKDKYIVIELDIGKVTNNKKDGKVLNTKSDRNYISYKGVKNAKKGEKYLTVLIYDNSKAEDDIAIRLDKKIK